MIKRSSLGHPCRKNEDIVEILGTFRRTAR